MKYAVTAKAAAALALLTYFGAQAQATPILVDPTAEGSSVSISMNDDLCAWCFADAELANTLEGEQNWLAAGQEWTFDFFEISVGGLAGIAGLSVDATLAFLSPDAIVGGNGNGFFVTLAFIVNGGALSWDAPSNIDLGDGTSLIVSFEDILEGGIGNSTTVSATVRRTAAAVPEPGTLALFGLGLLGLGLARRRSNSH